MKKKKIIIIQRWDSNPQHPGLTITAIETCNESCYYNTLSRNYR